MQYFGYSGGKLGPKIDENQQLWKYLVSGETLHPHMHKLNAKTLRQNNFSSSWPFKWNYCTSQQRNHFSVTISLKEIVISSKRDITL